MILSLAEGSQQYDFLKKPGNLKVNENGDNLQDSNKKRIDTIYLKDFF